MTDGITLYVNLAVSDRGYAHDIVPALARSHRAAVSEIIVTIDFTKPQKTKLTDPAVRCKEPEFTEQAEALRALAKSWQRDGVIDRVLCLRSDDPWLKEVTRKYSGRWLPETHDYGGRPITGYWAGLEAARTRYVVHYDGDMFLYQAPGFDWAAHAIRFMATQELALSACPRLAPPFAAHTGYGDYGSTDEGMWMYPVEGGWKQVLFLDPGLCRRPGKAGALSAAGARRDSARADAGEGAAPRLSALGRADVVADRRERRRLSPDPGHRPGLGPAPELEAAGIPRAGSGHHRARRQEPRSRRPVRPPRSRLRGVARVADVLSALRRRLADRLVARAHRWPALRALGKRLLRRRTVRQPFHGGVICLDAVEQSWAWTGSIRLESWDRHIQDRLLALSRDCRTMIDIGANLGAMSLSVALRNPDIAIICVEPNRRAAELLRQSIALNRLGDRVTVREAVAGQTDGSVGFEEDDPPPATLRRLPRSPGRRSTPPG